MAAISPPPIAPDLHEPLTLETWEAYRRTMNRWWTDWDAIDEDRYRNILSDRPNKSAQILLETFVHHPDYKGKSILLVNFELERSARHAQGLYKLRLKYPKPGPATAADKQETMAAQIATIEWGMFGGGNWRFMNAREMRALGRDLATLVENSDLKDLWRRIEIDQDVLARNRFGFLLHQEMCYKLEKPEQCGLSEYIRDLEDIAGRPAETNIALWLRHSRPKAAVLAVLALLAGILTGISALVMLGAVLVIYLVLSFVVYPWLLAPE